MATVVTVTGTFKEAPSVPASGEVVWRLSDPLFDSSGVLVAAPTDIVAPLVNGVMSVALYANDDSTTHPTGTTYTMTLWLDQTPPGGVVPVKSAAFSETYVISHASAPTVDISSLTQAVSTSQMTSQVTKIVPGTNVTISSSDGAGHGTVTVNAQSGANVPVPVNWCHLSFAAPAHRTVASPVYVFLQADITIDAQSGSDFSVGTDGVAATILSASGGRFYYNMNLADPDATALDGSSTVQRYAFVGANGGSSGQAGFYSNDGLDIFAPVIPGSTSYELQTSATAQIVYVPPGGIIVHSIFEKLVGAHGTDSIDISSGMAMTIWQAAGPPPT